MKADTNTRTCTVMQDAWDRMDFDQSVAMVPPLTSAVADLDKITELGGDMARDVFAALHKRSPIPERHVAPTHKVNIGVRDAILSSPAYTELHASCIGDPVLSGVAVASMEQHLIELYEQIEDQIEEVKQAAEAAEAAEAAYQDALDAAGDTPDSDAQATLDELRAAMQDTQAAMESAVDSTRAEVGRAGRNAVNDAFDEVTGYTSAMGAWAGIAGGVPATSDPRERFALMQMLRTDNMRRITDLFGRFRSLSFGAHDTRWTRGPDEVFNVELGSDLQRVLPTELVALGEPGLEDEFYRRFSENALLCYALRSRERVGRGPIVYVEDSSASMRGARYEAAKGLGLAIASTAQATDRAFHAVIFGGSGTYVERTANSMPEAIEYASTFLDSAGTDFVAPLDRAIELVTDTHPNADIVLVTDGLTNVPDEWVASFSDRKAALGCRLWTVVIGSGVTPAVRSVSDRVAEFVNLTDPENTAAVTTLFTDIAQENR